MIFFSSILASRSRMVLVSVTWASMPGSWASSELTSWLIRSAPFFTVVPDSKAIFTTLPASSADTLTPCTAVSVPTAVRAFSHESALTKAVVTVSGGGTNFFPWSIIALICRNLIPASMAMMIIRPRMAKMMRFFMVLRLR